MVSEDLRKVFFTLSCCIIVAVMLSIALRCITFYSKDHNMGAVVDIDKGQVTMSIETYTKLLHKVSLLEHLENLGVHNWERYDEAKELLTEEANQ